MRSAFHELPAMHRLLGDPRVAASAGLLGPGTVKTAVNDVLEEARRRIVEDAAGAPAFEVLITRIADRLAHEEAEGLLEVLNGTGILLHTNLGRAPLAPEALDAVARIAGSYSNLEFDLESGARGSRYARVTGLLREMTGAEDGLAVNNCAAAVLLVLDTFAKGREVIVSRNQLIEIGGGFRLPEVLARSGAFLIEVGTTNKVYLHDFERALSIQTALLMRTHASNYRIEGFVADVAASDLAGLGRRAGIPTLEDLGSGALVDLSAYGLPHERTVSEALADGIDMVTFSGDKLLGGPQAGIIVGKRAAIARMRANPLLRALRVDKTTLAALAATLRLYAEPDGIKRIPLYGMLSVGLETLRSRVERLREALGEWALYTYAVETQGYVGGGALPLAPIRSAGIAVKPPSGNSNEFAHRLRRGRPAVVGRVENDACIVDVRTIPTSDDGPLANALMRALSS